MMRIAMIAVMMIALLAAPLTAGAQQTGKVYRSPLFSPRLPSPT
jgi:hypothetical protein